MDRTRAGPLGTLRAPRTPTAAAGGSPGRADSTRPPSLPASTCFTSPQSTPGSLQENRRGEQPSTKGVRAREQAPEPRGRNTRRTLHNYSEGDLWTTCGAHPSRQLGPTHLMAFYMSPGGVPGTPPRFLSTGCMGAGGTKDNLESRECGLYI